MTLYALANFQADTIPLLFKALNFDKASRFFRPRRQVGLAALEQAAGQVERELLL